LSSEKHHSDNTKKLLSRSRTTTFDNSPATLFPCFNRVFPLLSGVQPAPHDPQCGLDGPSGQHKQTTFQVAHHSTFGNSPTILSSCFSRVFPPHRLLSGVQPAPHDPRCGSDWAIPRPSCTNNISSGAHLVIVINYRHPVQLTCNNKRKKNNNQSNQMRFVCKIMAELFVTPSRSLIKQIGRAWRNDRPPAA
jgi:hypothetical protein